jgi:hypothetical protein
VCGYVEKLHRWNTFRLNPAELESLSVHGGLTAGLGFDTAHWDDNAFSGHFSFPGGTRKLKHWVRLETEFLALQIASQDPLVVWNVARLQVRFLRRLFQRQHYRPLHAALLAHSPSGLRNVVGLITLVCDYACEMFIRRGTAWRT